MLEKFKRGSLQSKHGSSKIRTCYIYMGKCKSESTENQDFLLSNQVELTMIC